jgi:hypothetical protein
MKSWKWLVLGAVSALVVAICAGTAAANSPSITGGDAEALFNAGTTGGEAIKLHGGMIEGAPASPGRILPGPRFRGVHICASDWHVMAIYLATTDLDDGPTNVGEAHTYFLGGQRHLRARRGATRDPDDAGQASVG